MEPQASRARSRLQSRPPGAAVPTAIGSQPYASRHLLAHAARGRIARDNQLQDRSRSASGWLRESVRLFQRLHTLLWLASLGIPAQTAQELCACDTGNQGRAYFQETQPAVTLTA